MPGMPNIFKVTASAGNANAQPPSAPPSATNPRIRILIVSPKGPPAVFRNREANASRIPTERGNGQISKSGGVRVAETRSRFQPGGDYSAQSLRQRIAF